MVLFKLCLFLPGRPEGNHKKLQDPGSAMVGLVSCLVPFYSEVFLLVLGTVM